MNNKILLVFMLFSLLLVGCAGSASAKTLGDPEAGKILFNQSTIREAPGCATCHSVEPGKVLVGPSLAGVSLRAQTRIPGKPAIEYLYECIVDPSAYVVEGFSSGTMYQNFKNVLTEEEIDNLVAYLLTLE